MTYPQAWQNLRDAVESVWPTARYGDVGVVVGCSGGADSVALLRCLVESVRSAAEDRGDRSPSGFIVAAHFNHRFRGSDSDADADFVGGLAGQLDVPLETAVGNRTRQDEDSAREDRRSFFLRVMRRYGARYLALGHSLDDNVETVLYRLMRGTGPKGLAGISPFRPFSDDPPGNDFVIARPMLAVGRGQIRDALRSRNYPWREDRSNSCNEYRRNWIRNELVPLIRSQFPASVPAIGRAIEGQRQWLETLQPAIDRWTETVQVDSDPLTLLRLDRVSGPLRSSHDGGLFDSQAVATEALRRYWHQSNWPLRDMGHSHWTRIFEILSGYGPDAITLPGAIEVRRDDRTVTICRRI